MKNDNLSNGHGPGGFFEEGLRIISNCPVCHVPYNPMEARVLEENSSAHLIYIRCKNCQSAILALILTNNFGISSLGLITDLESQEVTRFIDGARVSSDDILSFYNLIKNGKVVDVF
ncbi:MAG: hypothetical protein WC516_01045 [Patescibacteria group bacterium]